jgi:hypothetical protein
VPSGSISQRPPTAAINQRPPTAATLRRRGNRGGIIDPHRSLATVRFTRLDAFVAILLSVGTAGVVLWKLGAIATLWARIFAFLAPRLGLPSGVLRRAVDVGFVGFAVPSFAIDAGAPSRAMWWVTLVVTVLVFLLSLLIRRNLPISYAIRLAAVTQGTALVFFGFWPSSFPYSLPGYVSSMLIAGATVLVLVPVVLGFTYYVLDVSVLQKVSLTILILGHLILFMPLQYALQSYLIYHTSLLLLPLSFMLFGLLPEVMIFIALYGWGVSWEGQTHLGSRE